MFSDTSNDNLIKLRKLTEEICASEQEELFEEYENKKIINKIKQTMALEIKTIETEVSSKEKLKCYERMFLKLNNILNTFNFK